MWCPDHKNGFSLLELLIVCLLISISLALAVPSLRASLATDELASASRKVISLVKSSRNKAVSSHKAFLIFYDAAKGKLWYQPAETPKSIPTDHSVISLPSEIRIHSIRQANIDDNHDMAREGIWISRQGYMDKTIIRLVDKNSKGLSLIISPFLPSIKVSEETVEL